MQIETTASGNGGTSSFRRFETELRLHAQTWTQSEVFARHNPDGVAIYSGLGNRSFRQLHQNANRIANALLASGVVVGDGVALMCRNRAEFIEVFMACMRIGVRLTPVNTHLTTAEAEYIVSDCQAKLFFVETTLVDKLVNFTHSSMARCAVIIGRNTSNPGAEDYRSLLARASPDTPSVLCAGQLMLYTSGTTGRPKGVYREIAELIEPQYAGTIVDFHPETDISLCCGPAYHAAPLLFDIRWPLASGVPIVLMEKWDAANALALIETHRVSHTHMVPTMFSQLLRLDKNQREGHKLDSLKLIAHGGAPCAVAVKEAMITWLGSVFLEYYGATEGGHGINIRVPEWLKKPGSVGKLDPSLGHEIRDDHGAPVAVGCTGKIYFKAPKIGRFSYFGDTQKTMEAYQGDVFTLGDHGYVDADGYLFLTGRIAECIISGGVNIYPQEIDNVLLQHEAVGDVCTVGVPDEEWGEKVVSLVVPSANYAANPELGAALLRHAAENLANFKRPRVILFATELPRSAAGKLLRQQVREQFWAHKSASI